MKIKFHLYYGKESYLTYTGFQDQINRCNNIQILRLAKVVVRIQRQKVCIIPNYTIQERLGSIHRCQ